MKSFLLISVAAGLMLTAGAAAAGAPRYNNCNKQVVRPAEIIIACADANYRLAGLRWSSWGGATAKAAGKAVVNDCKPYCAAGHFHTYAAQVTLSKLQPCGGTAKNYTVLTVTYPGKRPSGFKKTEAVKTPCKY
jgi:hypothetical protein